MTLTDTRLILLQSEDSIVVLGAAMQAGTRLMLEGEAINLPLTLGLGHKLARRRIEAGETVLKYGAPIGVATETIERGAHVHVHNLASRYTAVEIME
jgi:altronate dehydratase small subunit